MAARAACMHVLGVQPRSCANARITSSVSGELLSRAHERYVLPFLERYVLPFLAKQLWCFPRLHYKNITDLQLGARHRVRGVAEGLQREMGFGETSLGLVVEGGVVFAGDSLVNTHVA